MSFVRNLYVKTKVIVFDDGVTDVLTGDWCSRDWLSLAGMAVMAMTMISEHTGERFRQVTTQVRKLHVPGLG